MRPWVVSLLGWLWLVLAGLGFVAVHRIGVEMHEMTTARGWGHDASGGYAWAFLGLIRIGVVVLWVLPLGIASFGVITESEWGPRWLLAGSLFSASISCLGCLVLVNMAVRAHRDLVAHGSNWGHDPPSAWLVLAAALLAAISIYTAIALGKARPAAVAE